MVIESASVLPPYHIYVDWGRYDARSPSEWNDTGKATARFAEALREKGFTFEGGMVNDGAGWASWRNRMNCVISPLFPRKE